MHQDKTGSAYRRLYRVKQGSLSPCLSQEVCQLCSFDEINRKFRLEVKEIFYVK